MLAHHQLEVRVLHELLLISLPALLQGQMISIFNGFIDYINAPIQDIGIVLKPEKTIIEILLDIQQHVS